MEKPYEGVNNCPYGLNSLKRQTGLLRFGLVTLSDRLVLINSLLMVNFLPMEIINEPWPCDNTTISWWAHTQLNAYYLILIVRTITSTILYVQ